MIKSHLGLLRFQPAFQYVPCLVVIEIVCEFLFVGMEIGAGDLPENGPPGYRIRRHSGCSGETPRVDECSGEPAFMPIYLVRTIDEHDLVGIFVAPNVLALALLVDECVDPGDCEYSG